MKSQHQGVRHSLWLEGQLRNLGNNFQGKGSRARLPESRAQSAAPAASMSSHLVPSPAQQARSWTCTSQALCPPPQPAQGPGPKLGWCEASRTRLFSRAFATGKGPLNIGFWSPFFFMSHGRDVSRTSPDKTVLSTAFLSSSRCSEASPLSSPLPLPAILCDSEKIIDVQYLNM